MIKKFQSDFNLQADGIIGPSTANSLKTYLRIRDNAKAAHFLGQCHHESAGFTSTTENLNYSESGLLAIFSRYFTNDRNKEPNKKLASLYARNPKAIASVVYSNRMGNGDPSTGDGWKYRGRGPIQLSGKNNYAAFAQSIQNPFIMDDPDIIISDYYFESALFFFNANKLWDLCNVVNDKAIADVTKRVNGGFNGLDDRIRLTTLYYRWLTDKKF